MTDLDWLTPLHQAADGFIGQGDRPAPATVVAALLATEKHNKRQSTPYPFTALWGRWRLCFTTGTRKVQRGGIRLGRGFYIPAITPAYLSIGGEATEDTADPPQGTIGNQIQLGPVLLRLRGPCRYPGQKNLLAFDFTHLEIRVLGRTLYQGTMGKGPSQALPFEQQPIGQLPFFAFFYVSDRLIAARGRGGGLALWIRAEP